MITATWSADWNPTHTSTEDARTQKGHEKVVWERFELTLLDVHHRCNAVGMLNVEDGHEWAKRPMHITQAILRDYQAIIQAEGIALPRMKNASTEIVRMDHFILSVAKAILIYAGSFKLQYGVLFPKTSIKDSVEDMMPWTYLPVGSRLSCIWTRS